MKKFLLPLFIVIALIALRCHQKTDIAIDTNYYDLPPENAATLKEMLHLNAQNQITDEGFAPLRDYVERYFVKGNVPFDFQDITNTYFWYIYNALPGFVSAEERHSGYYKDQCELGFKDRLIAYSIYRIDRSPDNLQRLFSFTRPLMQEVIPADTYENFRIGDKINALITTYNQLKKIPDYNEKLLAFYARTYTPNGEMRLDNPEVEEHWGGAYSVSNSVLSEMICKALEIDRYSPLYGSAELSFWMRRNHEQNAEAVYVILKEIQQTYE